MILTNSKKAQVEAAGQHGEMQAYTPEFTSTKAVINIS